MYVMSGFGVLLNTKEEEDALRDGAFYATLEPSPEVERLTRDPSLGDRALSAMVRLPYTTYCLSMRPPPTSRGLLSIFLSSAARTLLLLAF